MNQSWLQGEKVRLAAPNLDTDAETIAGWSRNSEFSHLLSTGAPSLWTAQAAKAQYNSTDS